MSSFFWSVVLGEDMLILLQMQTTIHLSQGPSSESVSNYFILHLPPFLVSGPSSQCD